MFCELGFKYVLLQHRHCMQVYSYCINVFTILFLTFRYKTFAHRSIESALTIFPTEKLQRKVYPHLFSSAASLSAFGFFRHAFELVSVFSVIIPNICFIIKPCLSAGWLAVCSSFYDARRPCWWQMFMITTSLYLRCVVPLFSQNSTLLTSSGYWLSVLFYFISSGCMRMRVHDAVGFVQLRCDE